MSAPSPDSRALPCANTGSGTDSSPCENSANKVCSGCYLVQYCSAVCAKANWKTHKLDCKSPLAKKSWRPAWEIEKRTPAFMTGENDSLMASHGQRKYLWGNMPAFDILNLKQNEGVDTSADLRLMFAASGDLRNIVKTVTDLPDTYPGTCEIFVNDRDADIVARNAILLLTAIHFHPEEAAEIMLHVWYSVLLPEQIFRSLEETILPIFQDISTKIRDKAEDFLHGKSWIYGTSSVRLVLRKCQWDGILEYFRIPNGLANDPERAQKVRRATTLAPERLDYVDRGLFTLPPEWRVGMMKFRKDGILVPFSVSREEFDTPNPTFFRTEDFWPMMDSADPLQGWTLEDVLLKVPHAKNDIYGGLSLYLIEILTIFCQRLQGLKIKFHLFQSDVLKLASLLEEDGQRDGFDRIEASNIADSCHLNPARTLLCLSPFLRPHKQNPHATLITLFLNACHEMRTPSSENKSVARDLHKAENYLPKLRAVDMASEDRPTAAFVQMTEARMMFWDYDALFEEYMDAERFGVLRKLCRVVMKKQNTVIEAWPLRIKDGATQEVFDRLRASGHMGSERYVEWKYEKPTISLEKFMKSSSLEEDGS